MAQEGSDHVQYPEGDSTRTGLSVGQNGGEETHRIRAAGIAHRFDVGMFVDINARSDRDAFRQILSSVSYADADQRLGIGAHAFPDPVADATERTFLLQSKQQLH